MRRLIIDEFFKKSATDCLILTHCTLTLNSDKAKQDFIDKADKHNKKLFVASEQLKNRMFLFALKPLRKSEEKSAKPSQTCKNKIKVFTFAVINSKITHLYFFTNLEKTMKKQILSIVSILLINFSIGLAQTPTETPKTISGGVVNGKARSLPKPVYPAAARAVGASGVVNVQVTIDENGEVISASAVSGHPLLRQAAEQAARTAKFSPTLLQGQPVRVIGVIVYNFVAAMTFTQIGYELSLAEKSLSLNKYQISSIGGNFPKDWEEVTENLNKLRLYLAEKNEKPKSSQQITPPNTNADKFPAPQGIRTVIGISGIGVSGNENYALDSDAVEIVKQLQSDIANRLSSDENRLWSFNLGKILGKLQAEIDNAEKTQANITELNQLNINAPTGISESILTKIKDVIDASQQNASETEIKERLTMAAEKLRNLRGF